MDCLIPLAMISKYSPVVLDAQPRFTISTTPGLLRSEEHMPFWLGDERVLELHLAMDETVNAFLVSGFRISIINPSNSVEG